MSRESEARDLHECGRVDLSLGWEGQGEDRGMQHEVHLTRRRGTSDTCVVHDAGAAIAGVAV